MEIEVQEELRSKIATLSNAELREMVIRQHKKITDLEAIVAGRESGDSGSVDSDVNSPGSGDDISNSNNLRFRTWAETLPIGLIETDNSGNLLFSNRTALDWFSYSDADVETGLNVLNCVAPQDQQRMRDKISFILSQQEVFSAEYTGQRKDGSHFPILVSSYARQNQDHSVGLRGIIIDLSTQKEADEIARVKDFALRSSLGAIGLADLSGKIIYVNDAFIRLWGCCSEFEILGRSVHEFTMSDERMDMIIQTLMKGLQYEGEGKAKKADGTTFDVKLSAHRVTAPDGTPLCIMASFLDITERKEAQNKLAESEEWFRTTLNDMIEGYQQIDFDWRYQYLNNAAIEYSKKSKEQLIGLRITDVYPGIQETTLFRCLENCMTHRVSDRLEDEFYYPDGTTGWFEFHIQPTSSGISILTMNITDRKKSEIALIDSEEKYRSLFESTVQGIFFFNKEGKIISANTAAERILGIPSDQLLNRTYKNFRWSIIHEDGTPFPQELLPTTITFETGKESTAIMGIFNPILKKRIWLNVNSRVQHISEEDGRYFVYTTFEDITPLKEAINNLNRSNERLATLREVDIAISHSKPENSAVEEIVLKRAKQLIPCEEINIIKFDFEVNEAILESRLHKDRLWLNLGHRLQMEIFDFMQYKKGKSKLVNITPDRSESDYILYQRGIKELLCVPLHINDELIGLFTLLSDQKDYFTTEHIQITEDVASQLSVHLHRHKLMQMQKHNTETLEKQVKERTGQLLQVSEFQKAILDNAGMGIISLDNEGIIESFNPAAERLTGYSAEEVVGKHTPALFQNTELLKASLQELGYPKSEDNPFDSRILDKMLKGKTGPSIDTEYIRKDQTKVPVLLNITTLKNAEGQVTGGVGFVLDITQRKQIEEALRKNEERFSKMFYEHEAVMLLIDPESGKIVNANHAAHNFYGYKFRETEYNIEDINVLSNKTVSAECKKAINSNLNCFVFPHILASGDIKTVEVHSSPIEVDGQKLLFSIIHDITERNVAEQKLIESEAMNRAIIDAVPDFLFRLNREGRCLECFVNDETLLYVQREKFEGKLVTEVLPPEQSQRLIKAISEALNNKILVTYEYDVIDNSKTRYFENRLIAISEQEVLSILREITDRKEVELQLHDSEALNRAIICSVPDLLFRIDRDGTFLDCYSENSPLLYVPKENIIGKKIPEIFSPYDARQALNAIDEAFDSRHIISYEYSLPIQGTESFFENRIITISEHEVLTIIRDITDRKEMEEALRLSEQRWQFALEGAGDGVWDWNYQTDKIFFSHQWKTMLGYDDEDIKNDISEWTERVQPDDLIQAYENLNKHINGEAEIYTAEIRMRCKDGSSKWILTRGKLVEWTENDLPLRIIGTHTDITQTKLSEERLKQSVEREKELSVMKSRFISTASHEFRTPLASVLLVSESLTNYWHKMNHEQIGQKLQKIKEQTLHLTSIVTEVLQLSRIQEGKVAFHPEEIDLVFVCSEIADEFRISRGSQTTLIDFHTNVSTLLLHADRRLLRQILNNLISNAIKYSPENPLVDVTLWHHEGNCNISVTDNGIGIPVEDQKHLFTPFYRASNVRNIKGNGLGLNIMRESIRLHGGDVHFESSPGTGTTFIVDFPADRVISYIKI